MDASRARVLFVDDELRIVNLLRMTFRSTYEVFVATSGEEALQILSTQPIDVIVSDQRMPGMAGTELLSRAVNVSPATMRVLLTGYSDLAAIVGSVNDGEIYRFVNKPWDQDDLRRTIEEAVVASRNTRAAFADQTSSRAVVTERKPQELPYVMLIGESQPDLQAMHEVLHSEHRIISAMTLDEAILMTERFDIGVIVAEVSASSRATTDFLALLKQHYPYITTVMLTASEDSDFVIRLINHAQIFRFQLKPLRRGSFRLSVAAAMRAHLQMRAAPTLAQRHGVAAAPTTEEGSSLFSSMVRGLKRLRERLSGSMAA